MHVCTARLNVRDNGQMDNVDTGDYIVADLGSRRKRRQFVAEFGNSRRLLPNSATVVASVDRALSTATPLACQSVAAT